MAVGASSSVQPAWRALLSAATEEWRATPFYRMSLRGADAQSIELWGHDPRVGEAARGEELLRGHWRVGAERIVQTVASPWSSPHPSAYFTARLHSFSWLRDLAAAGGARELTAQVIAGWVRAFGEWHEAAWAPELTAERLCAWLCHGRPAFEGDLNPDLPATMRSIGRQARHLMLAAKDIRDPTARITAGAALTLAGASGLPEGDRMLDHGEELLLEAAASQFFSDGGHQSRSPESLVNALAELLIAEDARARQTLATDPLIKNVMARAADMIRLLTLGDGALGCFQGGGETKAALVSRVLSAVTAEPRAYAFANQSGFQRLQAGDLTLVMDVGGPPAPAFGARAHAGALAFEMASGAERMIVNVGAGRELDPEWRAAARATNAHSTLVVDEALSAPFSEPRRGRGAAYPLGPQVHVKRAQDESGVWVEAQHDGYKARFGFVTRRYVFMDHAGRNVRGMDAVSRPVNSGQRSGEPLPYRVRFHLHPSVQARQVNHELLELELPSGARWRFRTDAQRCKLESSVYLGANQQPQPTAQIVLAGAADPNGSGEDVPNRIRWALARVL
jgi:uncharacterized heparinase superfamily protein